MRKGNRANMLLLEMAAAVLLLAVSATTLARMYAAAYNQSRRAGTLDAALCAAQNLAERLYAAEDEPAMRALLESERFSRQEDAWRREEDGFSLTVTLTSEPAAAGRLVCAEIRADDDGETLAALPCTKYTGGEAAG